MDAKRAAMRRPQQQLLAPPSAGSSSDPEFAQNGSGCGLLFPSGDAGGGHPPLEKRRPLNGRHKALTLACLMISFLAVVPTLTLLAGVHRHASSAVQQTALLQQRQPMEGTSDGDAGSEGGDPPASSESPEERLLGGLLADGFDEGSCLSRYQSTFFRRLSRHKPSPHLLKKLRGYEAHHRKCGPGTELYREASGRLRTNQSLGPDAGCRYLVWISYSGLGNRMLTLASAFLYALLTDRVMLADRGEDMAGLFCEPFPEETWLLPLDFPLGPLDLFGASSPSSFGNLLRNKVLDDDAEGEPPAALPSFVYLHLAHDYGHHDKLFFCEQDQRLLQRIPWLVMRSDNYFVPSLFLIPAFEEELSLLFPAKELVFHHLSRYLFHPTNAVWGLITRFHLAYLGGAEERVGIQIRVFDAGTGPFQHVLDQIMACALREKLLPNVSRAPWSAPSTVHRKKKSLLITSLSSGYFEKIRRMYWENPTDSGEVVSVHQPSHEEHQQLGNQMHSMKALAEIYLLSLTDVLVTSSWSTFGYVAQGLGGLKPWILVKPENRTVPDPPCRQALSMEPCFHAPPFYDCRTKTGADTGAVVPHVRHCEDMSWGLKLVDDSEQ